YNASERGNRIAGKRPAVSLGEVRALGNTARIGMLDDDAGGRALRIELGDTFVGRIGIVDVVVGELFALQLPSRGDPHADIRRTIKSRPLMRVLAIAELLDQLPSDGAVVRRSLSCRLREPGGDGRVIRSGARIGLGGQLAPQQQTG